MKKTLFNICLSLALFVICNLVAMYLHSEWNIFNLSLGARIFVLFSTIALYLLLTIDEDRRRL